MAVIITDSTSDLTLSEASELGIEMLSLSVNFGSESYLDKREITNEEFYQMLDTSKELPTTSLINPAEFLTAFNAHLNEEIVVLTVSAELSGTWQSAMLAKKTTGRTDIHIVDTRNVTIGLAMLVRHAASLNAAGMEAEQIAASIQALAPKVRLLGMVNTLKYLVKGGRLSKVSGYMGGMLNIKPILTVADGKVKVIAKARGDKDAFSQMTQIVFEQQPIDTGMPVTFASSGNEAQRLGVFMRTLGLTGPVSSLGSVVGTYSGPGAVLLAYFEV